MNILSQIKNSIYNKEYYKGLLKKPSFDSLKYFLFLILIVSLFYTMYNSFHIFPAFKEFAGGLEGRVTKVYPKDLKITIADGAVSTNAEEPVFFSLANVFTVNDEPLFPDADIENLLVIDTKSDVTMETIRDYNTNIMVTNSDIVIYNPMRGEVRAYPADKLGDMVIDKEKVLSVATYIKSNINTITFVFILLTFLFLIIGNAFRLIYLFVIALPVWGISRIKRMKIGYSKAYQLSLHLITLPILISFLLYLAKVSMFTFLFSIILLISAAINLSHSEEEEQQQPASIEQPEATG